MRIIDKNTDFYDYLQYEFSDDSITFDRRNSFLLTKEMLKNNFHAERPSKRTRVNNDRFILLQVCNTFWVFHIVIEELDADGYDIWPEIKKYSVSLVDTWKNYNKPRNLIALNLIEFTNPVLYSCVWDHITKSFKEEKDDVIKNARQFIDNGDYEIKDDLGFAEYLVGSYENSKVIQRDIPLLSASGLAEFIDPLEMYRSIEEYFSLEKQSAERDSSIGITDKEKVINHGFDVKKSFRGKVKKE